MPSEFSWSAIHRRLHLQRLYPQHVHSSSRRSVALRYHAVDAGTLTESDRGSLEVFPCPCLFHELLPPFGSHCECLTTHVFVARSGSLFRLRKLGRSVRSARSDSIDDAVIYRDEIDGKCGGRRGERQRLQQGPGVAHSENGCKRRSLSNFRRIVVFITNISTPVLSGIRRSQLVRNVLVQDARCG